MLVTNYSYINKICGHYHSGITNPVWCMSPHTLRGYYGKAQYESIQEQIKRDSIPTGTNIPYSLIMGDKGGLLSSTTTILGDGELTSALSQGINVSSSLSGFGEISPSSLSLVISLASAISGSGSISVANLIGVVSLSSSLSSTGSLNAGLNVVAFMNSALNGSGSVSASMSGTLSMSAAIYVNQSEATIQQLVDGVWNALAVSYNNTGTMGEIMNNMGSVSDPWGVTLPGAYTGDQAGAIVDRLETLIKQVKALTAAQL